MKKTLLIIGIIIIIASSVSGVKKIISIRQQKKNQKITVANLNLQQLNNTDSQHKFLPSLSSTQFNKPISANDIAKDAKDAEDCGTCKGNTCQQITDCLQLHVADCTSAMGRVIYPISNTGKNRILTYVILGKNVDQCEVEGIMNNEGDSADVASSQKFDCQASPDDTKQLFEASNPSSFLMQNCYGTYVTFLRMKSAQNAANGSTGNSAQ